MHSLSSASLLSGSWYRQQLNQPPFNGIIPKIAIAIFSQLSFLAAAYKSTLFILSTFPKASVALLVANSLLFGTFYSKVLVPQMRQIDHFYKTAKPQQ